MRFLSKDTNVNFIGKRLMAFCISAFIIMGSVGLLVTQGLNFGIDFTGGTLVEIRTSAPADIPAMRSQLGALNIGTINIQEFGSDKEVLIRLPEQEGGKEAQTLAMESLRNSLGDDVEYRRVEFVGPQVGAELIASGLKAVIFSLMGILMYLI